MNKPMTVTHGGDMVSVPMDDSARLLSIIERALSDPSIDVDKLERIMAVAERMEKRRAKQAFDSAMMDAQEEMSPVRTDANNPQTKSKYATFGALDRAIRPTYTKHGFSLSFDTGESPLADHMRILCYVAHKAGDRRTYHMDLPADGKGAKGGDVMTKTHAAGSAFSYGRRYLEGGIFNVVVSNDDDGNAAGGNGAISQDDLKTLQGLIDGYAEHGASAVKLCEYFKVEALPDLRSAQFRKAVEMLNTKYAGKKRATP